MKIVIAILILFNILEAQNPCKDGKLICSYLYKTHKSREVYIINQSNKTIYFNATSHLSSTNSKVKNVKLTPNQRYRMIKKVYFSTDGRKDDIQFTHLQYTEDKPKKINIYTEKITNKKNWLDETIQITTKKYSHSRY